MNTFETTYIISAEKANLPDGENFTRTESLINDLKTLGLRFKRVLGCFTGRKEVSFVIVGPKETTILDLLTKYAQDCGLVLDATRAAHSLLPNGISVKLGEFKAVPEAEAAKRDHTFDPSTGVFYIIK